MKPRDHRIRALLPGGIPLEVAGHGVDERILPGQLSERPSHGKTGGGVVGLDLGAKRVDTCEHGEHVLEVMAGLVVAAPPAGERLELRSYELERRDRAHLKVGCDGIGLCGGHTVSVPPVRRTDASVGGGHDVDADVAADAAAERGALVRALLEPAAPETLDERVVVGGCNDVDTRRTRPGMTTE